MCGIPISAMSKEGTPVTCKDPRTYGTSDDTEKAALRALLHGAGVMRRLVHKWNGSYLCLVPIFRRRVELPSCIKG